jgi:hypothetical protein
VSPYPHLFSRLVANTSEPANEQACWPWTGKRDRWGYGRVNVYVPGLGKVVTLMAHIAAWVWVEAGCSSVDELWLAYQELKASKLELDHTCENESCIAPDHLDPTTRSENMTRMYERRALRVFPCSIDLASAKVATS